MLSLAGNARIFLCKEVIDMRKGFEGLSAAVERLFAQEITDGGYFVFLNRTRDKMKILYWDGDGLVIWYKRLEQGSFARLHKAENENTIDRREFLMLLEGVEPKKLHLRYKVA
jgi:transposase